MQNLKLSGLNSMLRSDKKGDNFQENNRLFMGTAKAVPIFSV